MLFTDTAISTPSVAFQITHTGYELDMHACDSVCEVCKFCKDNPWYGGPGKKNNAVYVGDALNYKRLLSHAKARCDDGTTYMSVLK